MEPTPALKLQDIETQQAVPCDHSHPVLGANYGPG
jgi:hypothetical protein